MKTVIECVLCLLSLLTLCANTLKRGTETETESVCVIERERVCVCDRVIERERERGK